MIYRVEVEATIHGYIEVDTDSPERAKRAALEDLRHEGFKVMQQAEPWGEVTTAVELVAQEAE